MGWVTWERRHLWCLFRFSPDIQDLPSNPRADLLLLLAAGQSTKPPQGGSLIRQAFSERLSEPLPRKLTFLRGSPRLTSLQDPKHIQEIRLTRESRNHLLCRPGAKCKERNAWVPRGTVHASAHLCSWLCPQV